MKVEHAIVHFLKDWIVLVLPLSVVIVRLVLFRFAGEMEQMYQNLFVIPQDLIFIAVSFILAGVSRTIPAYRAHFLSDTETDIIGFLQLLALLLLAWLLCLLNRLVVIVHRNFRTAWNQIKRLRGKQQNFTWKEVSPEIAGRLVWSMAYIAIISILIAVELLVSCAAVGYSLQTIRP